MKKLNFKTIIAIIIALLAVAFPSFRSLLSDVDEESSAKNISVSVTSSDREVNLYPAICTDVADGDTIHVSFTDEIPLGCSKNSKVRFVGVNTPEMNAGTTGIPDFFAKEATNFTTQNLLNKKIFLEFDDVSEKKDTYDRLLCYIWIEDELFNKTLIENGYGRYFDKYAFNSERMKEFEVSSKYAKQNKKGMWK